MIRPGDRFVYIREAARPIVTVTDRIGNDIIVQFPDGDTLDYNYAVFHILFVRESE